MAARANGTEQLPAAKTASSKIEWDTSLHLPPWVSSNERLQIEAKLDQWVRDLCQVALQNLLLVYLVCSAWQPMFRLCLLQVSVWLASWQVLLWCFQKLQLPST